MIWPRFMIAEILSLKPEARAEAIANVPEEFREWVSGAVDAHLWIRECQRKWQEANEPTF